MKPGLRYFHMIMKESVIISESTKKRSGLEAF